MLSAQIPANSNGVGELTQHFGTWRALTFFGVKDMVTCKRERKDENS
jgi:hypothetical protein